MGMSEVGALQLIIERGANRTFIVFSFSFLGFHFKPKDVKFFRWSTFPVFFGQLTGAYEGIGTVSHCVIELL